jgi:EAL domain-containing protein (putative c-di-GMP-specific phosphodiesterase class I)
VVFGKLKALGVRIAIDDFGTGHSSLSYLKRLPIDVLKIDRSFITGLPSNENDASITKAIITMAHSLGLKVVAEGVENQQQLTFLAENGCDEAQGFLFSRPVSAREVTQHIEAPRQLTAHSSDELQDDGKAIWLHGSRPVPRPRRVA